MLSLALYCWGRGQIALASGPRIISLAPSITETLFALGLGEKIVGVTRFCRYPKQAGRLPTVGGFSDPQLEKIFVLHPDIVFCVNEQRYVCSKLFKLGIDVRYINQQNIADIKASIVNIAKFLGKQSAAERLVKAIDESIGDLRKIAERQEVRPSVLVSVGGDIGVGELHDLYVAGRHTYLGEVISLAGGLNSYSGGISYAKLSLERLHKLDPEIIIDILPNKNRVTLRKKAWDKLGNLKAVRLKQVYVISDSFLMIPGPRVIQTLRLFGTLIGGEGRK